MVVEIVNIKYNEFDHLALYEALKAYKHPKDKITKLLKRGYLTKIKRGFYVKSGGPNTVISKEIIANLLYGPSYISLEYALSYYGLIPERVNALTSVTTKRKKQFKTQIGLFLYYELKKEYYSSGIQWIKINDGRGFFIASPEKAIIDKLYFEKATRTQNEMKSFLLENLRIEKEKLKELNADLIKDILSNYKKKSLMNLLKVIKKL